MSTPLTSVRTFVVGDWRAEPQRDVILREGTEIKLVPKSMEVLIYLAHHAGEVVGQEELETAVWRGVIVTPSSVYQAIADLRRALGDTPREAKYIATIPRKGYRLIAPVQWISDQEPAATPAAPADPQPEPAAAQSIPHAPATLAPAARNPLTALWMATAAMVVVAVAGAATWSWLRASSTTAPDTASPSITVLPIADFSAEAGDHFADGLTEEMLNTLAQLPGLRVTARTSAFVFKDRGEDVRAIGKMLGTRYVLEGSVRRGKGRIRVTAQLIDARNGYHLWSKTFDRSGNDVLAIQEDIARAVADSLQVTLGGESITRIAARRAASVDSQELYLLGRHYQLERTPDALRRAIAYHEQAIIRDPKYALAYAGLADAHMATYYYINRPLAEIAAIIDPLIEKGLELNPQLPELYAARAVLRTEQWQFPKAERDLGQAVALNPNYADAYVRLGAAYEYDGRPREALDAFSDASELDPLHFILHTRRCLALQNLGRYDEAHSACKRAIELGPTLPNAHWAQGLIALSSGAHPQAIAGYLEALTHAPKRVDLLGQLAWLYLDVGMPAHAGRYFDRAVSVAGDGPNFAYLTRSRLFIAADDNDGLRAHLDAPALRVDMDFESLLDLALLEWIADRKDAAQDYARRALESRDFDYARLFQVWNTRWGKSDVMTLALLAAEAGDHARSARYLNDLALYLDKLERNGQVWHGVNYLRAGVFAQQGRRQEAMAQLQKAAGSGWRRAWWARHDPALSPLRDTPQFERWLKTLDDSNAMLRSVLEKNTSQHELHARAADSLQKS